MYWERDPFDIQETDQKYGAMLKNEAYNILYDPEDCEECQNDAYLGIWNAIPSARPAMFPAFIMQITRRIAINRYKEKSRKKRIPSQLTISIEELESAISNGL
jgi:RNA polymerase sigma-70 factor (ECF subfamily)